MSGFGLRFTTGVPMVDEEHQVLDRLSRQVEEVLVAGAPKAQALEHFDRFDRFTRAHFAHEECLLESLGHPDTANHTADHLELLGRLDVTRDALVRIGPGNPPGGTALRRFFELEDALFRHVSRHDAAIGLHPDAPPEAHAAKATVGGCTPAVDSFSVFEVN